MVSRVFCLLFCFALSLSGWLTQNSLAADKGFGLEIIPDKAGHLYELGDTAVFKITVKNPNALQGPFRIEYRMTEDNERLLREGVLEAAGGGSELRGSLDRPGFLSLELVLIAGADTVRRSCACGFDPLSIRPTNVLPEDFERFWLQGRAELLRVPLDVRLESLPDSAGPKAKAYKISFANIENSRIFGWLTVPDGQGPFPAVLSLPGAGVGEHGPKSEYSDAGMIVLTFNIHGIEVGKDKQYQSWLRDGPLNGYPHFGSDDPYRFYYRRVILGAFRALDYLSTREDVDTTRLAVSGSSQGGALSLLVAGLDKRVKALTANVPAMCDHTGSLYGRPSGWPRLLAHGDLERVRRTSGYYDAALTAGFITAPALVAVGFIDRTCAPTTVYAAYNNLKGPKVIDNFPDMGHAYGPGWTERRVKWLLDALNRNPADQKAGN
ncbi:MAG TPA: acetylxylan esterase [archaeon]|nr:acetylxylan esterase [archaeon]